uniref:Uncharacterized protein n=1 Tax=Glossina brevipalpis TaxID=37001 RepID=A0A1A9WUQ0_9MUSC
MTLTIPINPSKNSADVRRIPFSEIAFPPALQSLARLSSLAKLPLITSLDTSCAFPKLPMTSSKLSCGLLNCVIGFLRPFLMNRFPRRLLLLGAMITCFISLELCFGIYEFVQLPVLSIIIK